MGTQHSFNDIADTDGVHISLAKFNRMEIAEDDKSVVVGSGTSWHSLMGLLANNKLALANIPSKPKVNVVGSLITGEHGAGLSMPILSHYVYGFRIMNPRGEMDVVIKG